MARYDAFGREIGEDPLEQLRGEAVELPATAPSVPEPGRRRPARRLAALAVLLGVTGAAVALFLAAGTVVDEIEERVPEVLTVDPGPGDPGPPARPAGGLDRGSFIRRENLQPALRRIERARVGRVWNMSIRPERINFQALTAAGRNRIAELRGETVTTVATTSGGGLSAFDPLGRLDAAAPQRLVRRGARELRVNPSTIDYVVPSRFGGALIWGAYFKGGGIVQGDAAGRFTRRVN